MNFMAEFTPKQSVEILELTSNSFVYFRRIIGFWHE